MFGSKDTKLQGKDNIGRHTIASEDGWTQDQTASDLGISRQAVTQAIQIAMAVYAKLRAERRIGEFSKELTINRGDEKFRSHHDDKTDILKQAGITNHARYEAIAGLTQEEARSSPMPEELPRCKAMEEALPLVFLEAACCKMTFYFFIECLRSCVRRLDNTHSAKALIGKCRFFICAIFFAGFFG
jgi:hypothetical protein